MASSCGESYCADLFRSRYVVHQKNWDKAGAFLRSEMASGEDVPLLIEVSKTRWSFRSKRGILYWKRGYFLLKWWNLQVHGELTPRFDEITAQVTWKMIDFFVEIWWFSIEIWWFSIEVWWFYNNQQAKNITHDLADQRLGWRGLCHGDTRVDNFCAIPIEESSFPYWGILISYWNFLNL